MKLNVTSFSLAVLALADASSWDFLKADTGTPRIRRVQELEQQQLEEARVACEESKVKVAELEEAVKPLDLALEAQQDALRDAEAAVVAANEACQLLNAEHDEKIQELEAIVQAFNNKLSPEDPPIEALKLEYQAADAIVQAYNRWASAKDLPFKTMNDILSITLQGDRHFDVEWKKEDHIFEEVILSDSVEDLLRKDRAATTDAAQVWINGNLVGVLDGPVWWGHLIPKNQWS